jgi:SAM-dependent methyltransferase/NADP-dependent 3-hydroxy acid dehydrogenase YdfG
MKPCGTPYLESLKQCGVKVLKGNKHCRWYSSVWGANDENWSFDEAGGQLLEGKYWVDNMTQSVLFSQALAKALAEDQYFDLALEVGPHPALKGPSSETIKTAASISLPYSGVLKRGQNAVASFADALGFLWKSLPYPRRLISFDKLRLIFTSGKPKKLAILKSLPGYSWDHSNLLWKESRSSRIFRAQSQPRHELLGHSVTYGEVDKREVHWKQLFRLNELPWLAGHRIQGEVLFPASGYLSMAYEAAIRLVDSNQPLSLMELHDIDIFRAMRLEEDSSGLEVVFTIRVTSQSTDCITAVVACYSGAVDSAQPLDAPQAGLASHFTAGVRLWLSQPDKATLPPPSKSPLPMEALDMDQLYSSLSKEGFNYTDFFQAKSMRRRLNRAVVTVSSTPESTSIRSCIHPASVDTALHGLLAGFSFPGDGRLGNTYLPTSFKCVRISMMPAASHAPVLIADTTVTSTGRTTFTGDLDLFDAADTYTQVQIRGIRMTAVGQRRDPWLYAGTMWVRDSSYGIEPGLGARLSEADRVLYEQLSRTAYYYLRQLQQKILPQELILMGKYRKHMMDWIVKHLFPQIQAGEHPDIKPEWKDDTLEMVEQWRASQTSDNNDMNILHAMGKNLINIVRGITSPLKVLTQDGMLDRLYVEGLGAKDGNADLGGIVRQLAYQHPRMRIIEVGAGTGGTTRSVLDAIGHHYASYTYTDISNGFFDNARTVFSQHSNKLIFKTLNIENSPADQGFTEGTFDMVISSNCLHATRSLAETLRHCRQLLRPGGRLVLLEITRDFLPTQLVMSTLPGWFLGIEDGRVWAPTVSVQRWDELLKANGFSGVDVNSTPSFCSVIMSQAVDDTIHLIRDPLAVAPTAIPPLGDILIVSGAAISNLASETLSILRAVAPSKAITVLPGLEGIQVPKGATVLSLADLDCPVFRDMNSKRFKGLQDIMESADVVLWVTSGAKSGKDPDANSILGLSSTLRAERMDLRLQFLDVDDQSSVEPSFLAKMLLRLAFIDQSKTEELLWTQEPELALRKGALYIPRVFSLDAINRRSAARLRQITQETSLAFKDTAVIIDQNGGEFQLQAGRLESVGGDSLGLHVTASSLHPLICEGHVLLYVAIGHDLLSGEKVLALSDVNSSLSRIAEDHVLYRWKHDNAEEATATDTVLLHTFLVRGLAEQLLGGLNGLAWIHDAPDYLSKSINAIAREQGLTVFQTTSNVAQSSDVVNYIHPYASEDDLQNIRPKILQRFINLTSSQHGTLSSFVRASLPVSEIVTKDVKGLTIDLSLHKLRTLAKEYLHSGAQVLAETAQILPVDKVSTVPSKELRATAIVDWNTTNSLTTVVRPLEHRGLFAPDKTYVLCGMTGDLGVSVCLWMVENGAQNVVLTSRNPNVPHSVLEYMSRRGATVRPMAVDITSLDSLRAAYAEIKSSMPPVGGVMNAAMVLRDRLFHRVSWEDFSAVLAPKIKGSKNLDEIFGNIQLDFFICFSSTTSIVGNIGQSAYAAANFYMASLIQQRRARGLAGSIIHIAILTGFGYIFRRDSEHAETIYKALLPRFDRQSETDLHGMLAEAIVCGRPGSDQTAELITGIKPVSQGEWHEDPRLSCYGSQLLHDDPTEGQGAGLVSVKAQLGAAEDPVECLAILERCFALAVGNLLEIDPEKLDSNTTVASLGIDSLVAIRIREWFLKETGVDVPVLKIMSDSYSISRMCEDVLVDWRRLEKP